MTMKMRLHIALGAAVATYMCACSATPCATPPHSNGQAIGISGVLHKEIHWGPPNFGENPKTDSKFAAWVLHVDKPFNAIQDSKTGAGKELVVTDIQLELSSVISVEQIAAFENKHIAVEGKLWKITTPGDVTDFNVSVTKITVDGATEPLSCVQRP